MRKTTYNKRGESYSMMIEYPNIWTRTTTLQMTLRGEVEGAKVTCCPLKFISVEDMFDPILQYASWKLSL